LTHPTSHQTVDWRRLKAVVLESDDWGLCAWVPDDAAHRALADSPAFRTPAGRVYGRSTLEHAADVTRLVATLLEFRGRDGQAPVWQANTVMASPDYARLAPPFTCDRLPLLRDPAYPSRWERPGLREAIEHARQAGVWWPELHGLVHLPESAWLAALRAGARDALAAHAQQCFVCEAVEASAEYDAREPSGLRRRALVQAVAWFHERFGRRPESLIAPDYRWDDQLEADAAAEGITALQGRSEQMGRPLRRLRHGLARRRWQRGSGRPFDLPPRIAFEPRGDASGQARLGAAHARRAVHAAWERGMPAVVSSHRVNYAHLDPDWSAAGRRALADLLGPLARDGAIFLTDAEVCSLDRHGWSLRPLGPLRKSGALIRCHSAGRSRVRFPAPDGATGGTLRDAAGSGAAARVALSIEAGEALADLDPGDYRLEWAGV
jgi:hypothetical protein